jgi:SAM-dependent methyltransferase
MEKNDWLRDLPEEIKFWQDWFDSKGLYWPQDFLDRQNPELEIEKEYADMFGERLTDMKILDAGCGPLTLMGKKYKGWPLDITCTDILANVYNDIMQKADIVPLIKPVQCGFEELPEMFDHKFDLIQAINCVDHSQYPYKSIMAMLEVLAPGGVLFMRHGWMEGLRGNYEGLHNWDFYMVDGEFAIGDQWGLKMMVKDLPGITIENIDRTESGHRKMISIFRKA